MSPLLITEGVFSSVIQLRLRGDETAEVGSVTGPGRSGAIAAVYASHILSIPFIPFGQKAPLDLGRLLIIDTAVESGATLRKAGRRYANAAHFNGVPLVIALYNEPPRVVFWYEAKKPQKYKHEE